MFQVTTRLGVQGKSSFFNTSHKAERNTCISVVIGRKSSNSHPEKKRFKSRIYTDSCLAFVSSQNNGHVVSWAARDHGKIGGKLTPLGLNYRITGHFNSSTKRAGSFGSFALLTLVTYCRAKRAKRATKYKNLGHNPC